MPDWKREIHPFRRKPKESESADSTAAEPAPTGSSERTSVLKKEIRLFKRKPKAVDVADVSFDATAAPAAAAPEKSVLKKEIHLFKRKITLFKRKPKDPDFDQPKPEKGKRKAPAEIPAIPLMRAFNLLPKEDLRQSQRRPATAQLILVAVTVVAVMGLGLAFMIVNAQVSDRTAERDELATTLAALVAEQQARLAEQEPGDDPALVLEEQARTTALSNALGKRIAWDRLLRDVSLVMPADVWLQAFLASSPPPVDPAAPVPTLIGSTLTINGSTRDQSGVARFLSRLETLPQLAAVQLLASAVVDQNGESIVQFSITAQVKPPPGASA